jgi:hypothetical protein
LSLFGFSYLFLPVSIQFKTNPKMTFLQRQRENPSVTRVGLVLCTVCELVAMVALNDYTFSPKPFLSLVVNCNYSVLLVMVSACVLLFLWTCFGTGEVDPALDWPKQRKTLLYLLRMEWMVFNTTFVRTMVLLLLLRQQSPRVDDPPPLSAPLDLRYITITMDLFFLGLVLPTFFHCIATQCPGWITNAPSENVPRAPSRASRKEAKKQK